MSTSLSPPGTTGSSPKTQKDTKEEKITELLVEAINLVIGEDGSPKWMERYHATDNRPVSYPEPA